MCRFHTVESFMLRHPRHRASLIGTSKSFLKLGAGQSLSRYTVNVEQYTLEVPLKVSVHRDIGREEVQCVKRNRLRFHAKLTVISHG